MRGITLLLAAAMLLTGCQAIKGVFEKGHKGDADLAAGVLSYEDGNYKESMRQLQSALGAGLSDTGKVRAHKHLAFIHCVSGRQGPCREEFRKALAINPKLELEPAEAGHPLWGPVFAKEKARR